jgi:branched-chain amino acid aminotransferase
LNPEGRSVVAPRGFSARPPVVDLLIQPIPITRCDPIAESGSRVVVAAPEFTAVAQRHATGSAHQQPGCLTGAEAPEERMRGVVYVNGEITSADRAVIPIYDHGFVYGEGIYETMRTYNRVPFLFDRHVRRLRNSAQLIHLDMPFEDRTLLGHIEKTVAAAGEMDEAYIRVLVTRGVGELTYDVTATPVPSLVIIVKPIDEPPARVIEQGITISLVSVLRNHPGSVNPIIKSNNLLNNALAMQEAYRRGGEEALMCNYRGELSECAQSNFFMVRGGVALTPASQAGLLEGVTRAFMSEVGQDVGVEVRHETLRPEDLATADEAFITSTTRELNPVVRIDDRVIGTGKPGPITLKLLEGYRQRARQSTRPASVR